jgi:hypothetical protein
VLAAFMDFHWSKLKETIKESGVDPDGSTETGLEIKLMLRVKLKKLKR